MIDPEHEHPFGEGLESCEDCQGGALRRTLALEFMNALFEARRNTTRDAVECLAREIDSILSDWPR